MDWFDQTENLAAQTSKNSFEAKALDFLPREIAQAVHYVLQENRDLRRLRDDLRARNMALLAENRELKSRPARQGTEQGFEQDILSAVDVLGYKLELLLARTERMENDGK